MEKRENSSFETSELERSTWSPTTGIWTHTPSVPMAQKSCLLPQAQLQQALTHMLNFMHTSNPIDLMGLFPYV